MPISQFPHCDSRILHAPGECEFCDGHPDWQARRQAWGIAFTGHKPSTCPTSCNWPNCLYLCHEDHNHAGPRDHEPAACPARWITQPCPADAARPPGSPSDHRRWGGNKPTSASGSRAWPAETAASHLIYGDPSARQRWPLRLTRPRQPRRKLP